MKRSFFRVAAVAGLLGPLLFAGALVTLSVVEQPFLRSLGWDPLTAPSRDWPSGLALGPQGAAMTAVFLVSGALLGLFAAGLGQALGGPPLGSARLGCVLLGLAGAGMAGLASPADPTLRSTPATWHGQLHDACYVLFGLALFGALLALGQAFRHAAGWERLAAPAWLAAAVLLPAAALKGLGIYVLILTILAWSEAAAWQLFKSGKGP
jgi:hypothetical protein